MNARLVAGLIGAAALASSSLGRAEMITGVLPPEDPTFRPIIPERRNGVALGASGGIGFAGASGYPADAKFRDNPDFYTSTPLLVGWSSSFFLMGALSDHVSFGPMVTIATFESPEWKSTGWALGFRGEVFPLATLVPTLADTAVYGQVGFGTTATRAKGPYPSTDGSQSFFGVGLHHEWRLGRLLGGHAAAGPYVEYDVIRAPSTERHWLSAGVRIVWYGGSVKLDHP